MFRIERLRDATKILAFLTPWRVEARAGHETRVMNHGLFSNHSLFGSLAARDFLLERTKPPPMVFTNHESLPLGFSRDTSHESRLSNPFGSPFVAHGARRQEPPAGASNPLQNQCFTALYFQIFTANCCAQVQMRMTGCAHVCAPSTVVGRPHDERRSPGNPAKAHRIPFAPGTCSKRSARRPAGRFRCSQRK